MVTLIAEQVRQQNATAAAAAADAAAIVPSFCVACSAHTHTLTHTHAHSLIHAHTKRSFHFVFDFHSLMNWLIFFCKYICDSVSLCQHCIWTKSTQFALNAHISFHLFQQAAATPTAAAAAAAFAASTASAGRRLFGRWNYFTCIIFIDLLG